MNIFPGIYSPVPINQPAAISSSFSDTVFGVHLNFPCFNFQFLVSLLKLRLS